MQVTHKRHRQCVRLERGLESYGSGMVAGGFNATLRAGTQMQRLARRHADRLPDHVQSRGQHGRELPPNIGRQLVDTGQALAVAGLAQWGANYAVVQSFPVMSDPDGLGLAGTYLVYTVSAVISIFLVRSFIQETKGKELEDMQG